MDKKGEQNNLLAISIFAFVGIIMGLVLLTSSTTFIGQSVNNYTFIGQQAIAAASTDYWLTGQDLLNTPTAVNATGGLSCTANVTFSEGVNPTTGVKAIKLTSSELWTTAACSVINISYAYGANGYIDDSGGRAVANLIPIFFVLAIIIVALVPTLRNGVLDLFRR